LTSNELHGDTSQKIEILSQISGCLFFPFAFLKDKKGKAIPVTGRGGP
jgi:hypothetical protein